MLRLPHIPTAQDLIDKSCRGGSKEGMKARAMGPKKPERILTGEIRRVQIAARIIEGELNAIVEQFPMIDEMSAFHQSLLDLRVKRDRYKKSLATVRWCSERISSLRDKTLRKLKTSKESGHSGEFLGRASSFIKRIGPDLKYLIEAKDALLSLPMLRDDPTLVVAGIPNAGKSTFVRTLTGSKVKVASYPFTTTEILVGYKKVRHSEYQIIDSPGILDRPMNERNMVELKAVLAIKHLADVVLFLIDPQAGLGLQENLCLEIRDGLGVKVVAAVNDKGGELPTGYPVFNATKPEDCDRMFRECFGISTTAG